MSTNDWTELKVSEVTSTLKDRDNINSLIFCFAFIKYCAPLNIPENIPHRLFIITSWKSDVLAGEAPLLKTAHLPLLGVD